MKPYILLPGKADHVSREQVRAYLSASYAVLAHHNLHPSKTYKVRIKSIPASRRTRVGGGSCVGWCNTINGEIVVCKKLDPEAMLTTILHEAIHSVIDFPMHTLEKCTSTLASKLKPFVGMHAQLLLDNTYRIAAYIAHTRPEMAYEAKVNDHYDDSQYRRVGIRSKYHNKRRGA